MKKSDLAYTLVITFILGWFVGYMHHYTATSEDYSSCKKSLKTCSFNRDTCERNLTLAEAKTLECQTWDVVDSHKEWWQEKGDAEEWDKEKGP